LQVCLSLHHALNYVSKLVKRTHGGFCAFRARKHNVDFVINSEGIMEMDHFLEALGPPKDEVSPNKDKDWACFLCERQHCFPPPTELLECVDIYFSTSAMARLVRSFCILWPWILWVSCASTFKLAA
ncbi:unnamed protein product, partial [Discosporangium mesarthrocarpum]